MTTKQLVIWMDSAISISEASWNGKKYTINRHEALTQSKPSGTLKFEEDIATSLIGWGNDITDWANAAKQIKT